MIYIYASKTSILQSYSEGIYANIPSLVRKSCELAEWWAPFDCSEFILRSPVLYVFSFCNNRTELKHLLNFNGFKRICRTLPTEEEEWKNINNKFVISRKYQYIRLFVRSFVKGRSPLLFVPPTNVYEWSGVITHIYIYIDIVRFVYQLCVG